MEGRFDALEKQISQLIHALEDLTAQVQSLAYSKVSKTREQQFVELCPAGSDTHIFWNVGGGEIECKLCRTKLIK